MQSSPGVDAASRGRLRLAFVIPRFTEHTWGGAELLCRWQAERLSSAGHDVDVFTTCAVDHRTWKNVLPPGVERYGSVTVRRFPADERDLGVFGELERAIQMGFRLSIDEELLWLRNGVSSRAMEEELEARGREYDLILALPYLFGTTYFAFAAQPDRTALVPCLHDEPYAHLGVVGRMLREARGLMFNAAPEAELAARIAGELAPWTVVGTGFDPLGPGDPDAFRAKYGLRRPFLLYVGRREGGKNTPLLYDHFLRYRRRRQPEIDLVLAGSGDPVPREEGLVELDLDWADRDAMYRAATVFCQPSVNESFSIVLMQAWLAECPALVHGGCAVTRDHCERADGGLWFTNYAVFEAVCDRLLSDEALRRRLGRNGRSFVEREYSWEAVLSRFDEAAYAWSAVSTGNRSPS